MVAVGHRTSTEGKPCAIDLQAMFLDDVFRYVSAFIRPPAEAEDVTMNVFHAAIGSTGRLKGDPRLWLLGIARRKVADSLRRRYRRRESCLTPSIAIASTDIEDALIVSDVLAQIPPEHGQVLVLKYVNGLAINEIANLIGKSDAATNSLLQRARESFYAKGAPHFLHLEDHS